VQWGTQIALRWVVCVCVCSVVCACVQWGIQIALRWVVCVCVCSVVCTCVQWGIQIALRWVVCVCVYVCGMYSVVLNTLSHAYTRLHTH
jgi:hypothetical protein